MNEVMISVLDVLTESNATAATISDVTALPVKDIDNAIDTLMDINAVGIDDDYGTPIHYKLLATPVLYCNNQDNGDGESLRKMVKSFQESKTDYYSTLQAFSVDILNAVGIKMGYVFERAGNNLAHAILDILDTKMTPEELLEFAPKIVSAPNKAELVSKVPLKYRMTVTRDSVWQNEAGEYVRSFVKEGLRILLDEEYKVDIETIVR